MPQFKFKRVRELVRQLKVGPPGVRRRQVERLEELLLGFDPERTYPWEFLYFRVTGFRPEDEPAEAYEGAEVLPDLSRALETLSATVPRTAEELDEEVYTLDQLSERFSVSTRTIRRWRRRGLVAATYRSEDGRKRVGATRGALDAFLRRHGELVERSASFSRLSGAEERRIVELAHRCAEEEGMSLTAAAERIAAELDRATETVRLALVRHEESHPEEPIFAEKGGRLGPEERRSIYELYRQGVHVDELCDRYDRSRSTVYRIINQQKARELLARPLSFHHEACFQEREAEETLLGEELDLLLERLQARAREEQPPGTGRWTGSPLSEAEETALFRACNYSAFRAEELRGQLDPSRYVRSSLLKRIQRKLDRAETVRQHLVRVHLPLVEQIARQHASPGARLERVITLGHRELSRLVERFDYRGPGRFPGYVSLELMKTFARTIPAEGEPAASD
jgi:transposase